jgi:hypothetical protein
MITARELKLTLRKEKKLYCFKSLVLQFDNQLILVEDTNPIKYPPYLLTSLEDISQFQLILKNFSYTGRSRLFFDDDFKELIELIVRVYGQSISSKKAWELIK